VTPTTDDNGQWLSPLLTIAGAALSLLAGWMGIVFWKYLGTLATKAELAEAKLTIINMDEESDHEWMTKMETALADGLRANREELLRLHAENTDMFREIRDDVKQILARGARRPVPP
jgi:hypothetical protein